MGTPSVFDYINAPDDATASLKGAAIQDALRRDQQYSALAAMIGDPALATFSKDVGGQAHDLSKELMQAAHQRQTSQVQQKQWDRQSARDAKIAEYQARMADAAERRANVMEGQLGLKGSERMKVTDQFGNTTLAPKYGGGGRGPGGLTVPSPGGGAPSAYAGSPQMPQGQGALPGQQPQPTAAMPFGPPAPAGAQESQPGVQPGGAAGQMPGQMNLDPLHEKAFAIMRGEQPPPKGRELSSKLGYQLSAILGKHGFDLSKASLEYTAAERFAASANSNQQLRLRQAVTAVRKQLDNVKASYAQWQKVGPQSGYRDVNAATLGVAKRTPGPAGAAAAGLEQQIALLHGELGTAMMGGGSPTDHALLLAQQMLRSDWNGQTMATGLSNLEKDLQVREYAMSHVLPAAVTGAENRYTAPAPGAAVPAGPPAAHGAAPAGPAAPSRAGDKYL